MIVNKRLLVPCLFLTQLPGFALADVPPVDQTSWPQKVVVNVGDIRTRIDGPKLWTLSGIDYQNTMMGTEESAYGTVVTIRGVGNLGTAHFLDAPDKPGKVEKENVTSLKFFVDGKPVEEFKPTMDLKGQSFRMERASNIRDLDLKSSVDIRDGVLIETAHLHANKAIDFQRIHPLMYAWSPGTTVYVYGDDNGIQKRGAFVKEGATAVDTIKGSRWAAVFNPAIGKGSVCYVTKHPPSPEEWFLMIDAPGIYHKIALYTLVDKIAPEGFDGTYQTAIGFFSATEKDWEQQALLRMADLKKLREEPVQTAKPAN